MKNLPFIALTLLGLNLCLSQKSVRFEVSDIPYGMEKYVGIRGDTPPLSWEKTIFLTYDEERKHYWTIQEFPDAINKIEYKFVLDKKGGIDWEGINNRAEILNGSEFGFQSEWNTEKFIDPSTLPKLGVRELQEDFEVIKNAILKVHPGLYRYNDSTAVYENLMALKKTFQEPLTYGEAFLAISKYIVTIQCDHTSASAYNQEAIINSLLHARKDKVPFAFQWIDGRMIVTRNASGSDKMTRGTEILTIEDIPVSTILDSLLIHITADGSTIHNKISKAEVDGYGFRYSAFDMLYPLLFPMTRESISLRIKNPGQQGTSQIEVKTLTRKERSGILANNYADFPKNPGDLWSSKILEGNIGYLQLGSFATDDFQKDWKQLLQNAFRTFEKAKVKNLVLDIRENQGGLDDASYELERYIFQQPLVIEGFQSQSRFLEFPEEVKPHVKTWDYWFYNLKDDEHFKKGRYYVFPRENTKRTIRPSRTTFKGNIYMLTSAKNVSGAFYLARLFKRGKGVLLGQETGGNQNGINGGAILFLKPPNSRINVNMPVVGSFATESMPNAGIEPDVPVKKTITDVVNGVDPELERALELIKNENGQ